MSHDNCLVISTLQPKIYYNQLQNTFDSYLSLLKTCQEIQKTQVICLPEYWNGIRSEGLSSERIDKSLNFLESLAHEYSVWLIGGSQLIKENNLYYNRCHIFNPSGEIIGQYDKQNPFGFEKQRGLSKGKRNFIGKIGKWKISIRICSDLWIPSSQEELINNNIDLLFCPSLTTLPKEDLITYGRFMWYNLSLVRAKEAAAGVIVSDRAAQIIRDPFWSAGASCIVDPSKKFSNNEELGFNILKNIPSGEFGIITSSICYDDIQLQKSYRKSMGLMLE